MKKYVLVGTGGRAEFFYGAIVRDFREACKLVAFCDLNQTRMDYANRLLEERYDHPKINTYVHTDFERMIEVEKPDTVVVTTVDRTHHTYIIKALEFVSMLY